MKIIWVLLLYWPWLLWTFCIDLSFHAMSSAPQKTNTKCHTLNAPRLGARKYIPRIFDLYCWNVLSSPTYTQTSARHAHTRYTNVIWHSLFFPIMSYVRRRWRNAALERSNGRGTNARCDVYWYICISLLHSNVLYNGCTWSHDITFLINFTLPALNPGW